MDQRARHSDADGGVGRRERQVVETERGDEQGAVADKRLAGVRRAKADR